MKCPWCGVENAVGAETCSICGVILPARTGTKVRPADPVQQHPQYQPPPPQYQPPPPWLHKKNNNIATIAIVILILVGAMLPFAFILSMNNQTSFSATSNSLEGTWKTAAPVTFYQRSNWPGSGELQNFGSESRDVTFVITGTSDPGIVQVEVTFVVESSSIWNGSTYSQDISPEYFTGRIDGMTLILDQDTVSASFSFNEAAMIGTWNRSSFFGSYSEELYTDNNALTLYRQ